MSNADWANKDFYKTLGVAKDADAAAIKKAYRKLARENHPDSKPGDKAAEERFKEIAEAYDVLGETAKRKEYDEMRALFAGGGFPRGGAGGFQPGGYGQGGPGAGFDLSDLLGGLFGGGSGGGPAGAGPAGFRQGGRRVVPGDDLETSASISFDDAINGTTISLRVSSDAACETCRGTGGKPGTKPHVCPTCDGSGMVMTSTGGGFAMNETCPECHGRQYVYEDSCPTCHGSGRGRSSRTIQARLPAGVKDGQRIRLKGKGAASDAGGPPGDLFVTVRVPTHPLFGRKDDNLTVVVPVRFDELVLGAEIRVPTPTGAPVTLRVPAGTPNGRVMRVRGRGVGRRDGSHGDLLVTVEVQVPTELDDATRAAVDAYRAAAGGTDPRAALFETSP